MIEEENDMFYTEGDKLLEDYDNYVAKIGSLVINNPDVQGRINSFVEVTRNNMILLSKIMTEINELENSIQSEIKKPHLQSMDAVRTMREYIKLKQSEYLIRVSNYAKIAETLFHVLDRYEDYENACAAAGINVEEIGPKEREEMKGGAVIVKKEDLILKVAEMIDEYRSVKKDLSMPKKRLKLNLLKKKIKDIGTDEWIGIEFEKHTGDKL